MDAQENGAAVLTYAYQPILRGYFGATAVYYALMSVVHALTLVGDQLALMGSVSLFAWLACSLAWYQARHWIGTSRLELITTGINLLVVANVMVALHVAYDPGKLVYFIMLTMVFAFASVSIRQALVGIAACFVGLYFQLTWHEPGQMETYGFVSFAAAMAALGITHFLRRTVRFSLMARSQAERDLRSAETRLTAAQQIGEAMRQQSLSDSLTGLPNRRAFFEELKRQRGAILEGEGFWLILLDLDGFKAVNDNYGHLIGDELLRAVASRLVTYCGEGSHVSRIGGDEFNIVVPRQVTPDEIEEWCEGLLAYLASVYLIEDRLILISGSIGCCAGNAVEPETTLIQKADYALLHAKRNGKNRVEMFRDEHANDAAERFRIEQALRFADFDAEIELLFQPQFDLSEQRIVAAEALARWNSPVLGLIGPERFIQIAEESGQIARITTTVLNKAISILQATSSPICLSINLSGHDIISEHVVDRILEQVLESGVRPELIEFEVTETAMMPDIDRAKANLQRLADIGHPLALDDFGTGYSNYRYLRDLPIQKLKVDRGFLLNPGDPMTEKMLHSLSGLARTLDVQCLLEGVESEIELLMAKRVGANAAQGYLFGRPMEWDQLLAKLENQDAEAEAPVARRRAGARRASGTAAH